jgi:hypothetical protein
MAEIRPTIRIGDVEQLVVWRDGELEGDGADGFRRLLALHEGETVELTPTGPRLPLGFPRAVAVHRGRAASRQL